MGVVKGKLGWKGCTNNKPCFIIEFHKAARLCHSYSTLYMPRIVRQLIETPRGRVQIVADISTDIVHTNRKFLYEMEFLVACR